MCLCFQECVLGYYRGRVYSFSHPHSICVYTTLTYKILKEEKYRPILITVGLGGVLEMLPLGVDLQACADFMATYDASSQIDTFTKHDGLEIQVHITPQLVADALQMDLTTPKVNPISLPTLKA